MTSELNPGGGCGETLSTGNCFFKYARSAREGWWCAVRGSEVGGEGCSTADPGWTA